MKELKDLFRSEVPSAHELLKIKEQNEAQFEKDSLKKIQVKILKPTHMIIGDEVYTDNDALDQALKAEKKTQVKRKKSKEELNVERLLMKLKKEIEAKSGR